MVLLGLELPLSRILGSQDADPVCEVLGDRQVFTSGHIHDDPSSAVSHFLQAPLHLTENHQILDW